MKLRLNWFERAIQAVAPNIALKRQQALVLSEHIRSYDAASRGRRTSNWNARGTSSNSEIHAAASTLRNRSRDLSRNNPFAKKAVQSISNNTIGTGIRAKITGTNKAKTSKVTKAWTEWSDSTECDNESRKTLSGIQKMVMRAVVESGDCLILKRIDRAAKNPLKLVVLEIDYLDMNKNSTRTNEDGSYDFLGIRFSKTGKRIGYWLYDVHPGETGLMNMAKSRLVPASSVIHVFEQLRPGQQLGVPYGVSAFLRVRDVDEYNDAQVVRQKLAACFSVFIRTDMSINSTNERDEMERVEPGMIQQLGSGEDVQFATPPSVENFEEFHRTMMYGIGAGYGLTYQALTGDYSQVNFSSGKMGHIEFNRNIEDWQWNMIIPQFLMPVWNWFVEAAELKGIDTTSVTTGWTPPRREMIDVAKEAKGYKELIRMGLISMQDAIAEQGYQPEEVVAEIVEWNKMLDNNGIKLDSDPRQGKGEASDGRGRPTTDGGKVDENEDTGK